MLPPFMYKADSNGMSVNVSLEGLRGKIRLRFKLNTMKPEINVSRAWLTFESSASKGALRTSTAHFYLLCSHSTYLKQCITQNGDMNACFKGQAEPWTSSAVASELRSLTIPNPR